MPMYITLGVLIFAIVMMAWNKIPIAMTALITLLILVITKVLTAKEAFAGFSNSNVILISSMIVIGYAFFTTGMAEIIAQHVLKYAHSEKMLIFLVLVVTGLMSATLSNTGVTAVMMPIVIGICSQSGINRSRLMMPISIGAGAGGTITLVGTVVNVMANTTLEQFGYTERFSFFEFSKIGLPLLFITAIFMCSIGRRLLPDRPYKGKGAEKYAKRDFSNVPNWKKYMSLAVLIAVFVAMIFQKQIGLPLHVISTIGAVFLVLCGILTEEDAYQSLDMRTIFLLGGILPLATAMAKTGAGKMIADGVIGMCGKGTSPLFLMAVLYLLSCLLTQFMSNTATAALLCPIGISIAQGLGVNPKTVLLLIVLGASFAYATPLGMPANTMVMEPGSYTFNDYVKVGIPLLVISFAFCMFAVPLFWSL